MEELERRRTLVAGLTAREREVLEILCEGQSIKDIAKRLCISEATVQFHLSNLYQKLGIAELKTATRRQEIGKFCMTMQEPNELAVISVGQETAVEGAGNSRSEPATIHPNTTLPNAETDSPQPIAMTQPELQRHNRIGLFAGARRRLIGTLVILLLVGSGAAAWYMWGEQRIGVLGNCPNVDAFGRATPVDPSTIRGNLDRGNAYYERGMYACAIADFTYVLQINPDPWIYYRRGVAYYKIGTYDQAITDMDSVLRQMPSYGWAYYVRSMAFAAKGDCEQAVADLNNMLQVPDNANSWQRAREQLGVVEPCREFPGQPVSRDDEDIP
jgi:DNA-binding CsgD family transcriptional regulator